MSDVMEKDFILFASRASKMLEEGKVKNALYLCEAGVRRFPGYADGHLVLGLCYKASDKKDDARAEFERALNYAPNNLRAMKELALFFKEEGLRQLSTDWLKKARMFYPYDDDLQEQLAATEPTAPEPVAPVDETDDELLNTDDTLLIPEEETPLAAAETTPDKPDETEILDLSDSDLLDPLADEPLLEVNPAKEQKPDLSGFDKTDQDFALLMDDMFVPGEEEQNAADDEGDWLEVDDLILDETVEISEEATATPEEAPTPPVDETEMLLNELQKESPEDDLLLSADEEPESLPETAAAEAPAIPVETMPPPAMSEMAPADDEEEEVTIEKLMTNPSLITPTFGEILIAQKKFNEARHVFGELCNREPDNPRFKKKIAFLDKFLQIQS
ncbi:MAG: tetratricopeptide repeat protein [Calditrichaeota bacterium]|nr:MAG: tetratricopeptide repeat protein [Calditrichota bacterium]